MAAEAATPSGFANGVWAYIVVAPAAGFLLSLSNFYFIRLYRSRRAFSAACCCATLAFTLTAFVFTFFYYDGAEIIAMSLSMSMSENFEAALACLMWYGSGLVLTAAFCAISKIASRRYAELLGKE